MLTEQTSAGVEVTHIKRLGHVNDDLRLGGLGSDPTHQLRGGDGHNQLVKVVEDFKLVTQLPISGHFAVYSRVVTHAHESKLAAGAALNGGGQCARCGDVHNAYPSVSYVTVHRASRPILRTMHQSIESDKRYKVK